MPQIIERKLAVASALEIETGAAEFGAEIVTATGIASLVQHLLAQSVAARAQPGHSSELYIQVTSDEQRIQIGGRVVVRWIVAERRRALGAVEIPL